MSEDRRPGEYSERPAQHRRRAEDRLPPEYQPRYSEADLTRAIAQGIREALEVRDSDPTGLQDLPRRDPAIDEIKPRLHFTARVLVVLAALAIAAASVAAGLAWTGGVVDDRAKAVLVRAQLACPELDPSVHVEPRYACKTIPQQLGEIRDGQSDANLKLDAVLRRLPAEPAP